MRGKNHDSQCVLPVSFFFAYHSFFCLPFTYPAAKFIPATNNSPTSPALTGRKSLSSKYIMVLSTGKPESSHFPVRYNQIRKSLIEFWLDDSNNPRLFNVIVVTLSINNPLLLVFFQKTTKVNKLIIKMQRSVQLIWTAIKMKLVLNKCGTRLRFKCAE